MPFEMVDAVLGECGAVQRRLRKLPARVVVYLLLTAVLFEECGYRTVGPSSPARWVPCPCRRSPRPGCGMPPARGLACARCVPCSTCCVARHPRSVLPGPAGRACWAGLLVVAIDGTYLHVPDDPATRARLGRGSNQYAVSGYPQIYLVALVACGTQAVLDAMFGPRVTERHDQLGEAGLYQDAPDGSVADGHRPTAPPASNALDGDTVHLVALSRAQQAQAPDIPWSGQI